MQLQLIFDNEELDLNLRHADCAIRLRQPQQPDLIQKRLFTVHFHAYATPAISTVSANRPALRNSTSTVWSRLASRHRIYLTNINLLETIARPEGEPRTPVLQINSLLSVKKAVQRGVGHRPSCRTIWSTRILDLQQILLDMEMPSFDTYFCYPETLKNAAKLNAFRDFLFAKARAWSY